MQRRRIEKSRAKKKQNNGIRLKGLHTKEENKGNEKKKKKQYV